MLFFVRTLIWLQLRGACVKGHFPCSARIACIDEMCITALFSWAAEVSKAAEKNTLLMVNTNIIRKEVAVEMRNQRGMLP